MRFVLGVRATYTVQRETRVGLVSMTCERHVVRVRVE